MHLQWARSLYVIWRVLVAISTLTLLVLQSPDSSVQERPASYSAKLARAGFNVQRLESEYVSGGHGTVLHRTDTTPISLAAGDINHDGYPDVVAGYATPSGGLLVAHLANPEAFAPETPASRNALGRGQFAPSFAKTALVISIATRPDILATGDFDGDGCLDLLFAPQGGESLCVAHGDGRGHFGEPQSIKVPGKLTAVVVGALLRSGGGPDVVIGVDTTNGPAVAVYDSVMEGLSGSAAIYPVSGTVVGLTIGDLDGDEYPDVAIVAASRLMILHGTGSNPTAPTQRH